MAMEWPWSREGKHEVEEGQIVKALEFIVDDLQSHSSQVRDEFQSWERSVMTQMREEFRSLTTQVGESHKVLQQQLDQMQSSLAADANPLRLGNIVQSTRSALPDYDNALLDQLSQHSVSKVDHEVAKRMPLRPAQCFTGPVGKSSALISPVPHGDDGGDMNNIEVELLDTQQAAVAPVSVSTAQLDNVVLALEALAAKVDAKVDFQVELKAAHDQQLRDMSLLLKSNAQRTAVELLASSAAQPEKKLQEKGNISIGVQEKEHDCSAKQLQGDEDNSDSSEQVARIEHEFSVPMLPFLDEAGQISHVTSPFEHILDKLGLSKMPEPACLKASCLQAHEGRLKVIADSHWFKMVSAVMIMLNYYYIIHQTDFKMSHLGQDEPAAFFVIEVLFTVFYVGEIICQVLAYRKEYFLGHDMLWNLFDLFIVLISVFELIVTLTGGKAINLSFLKVLRFLKISRVLRMFSALRLMKEIKIMVDALAGSFLIFVFCSIMFAMFFSIFAIFFVQGMTSYLESTPTADVDQQVLLGIKGDFGSVSTTMLSLFMAVTGGNDWTEYHETVAAVGATYNFLFLFFIGFSTISFLNVITGVFAEKAMNLAAPTVDELMLVRTKKEKADARELVNLLHDVLGSDTHVIGHESLETLLDHPQVVRFLETRGLKPSSARRFFMLLLEVHHTSTVDFGTFVSGCVKLDGSASSIDLHVLSAELKSMQLRQHHQSQDLKASLEKINTCMESFAICDETIEPSLTSVMPQSSNDGSGSSSL